MRYPRYTTYGSDEELTAAIITIDPLRQTGATAQALRSGNTGGSGRLVKSYQCSVLLPDGTTGSCCYTRGGPAWHVFRVEHPGRSKESIRLMGRCALPAQHVTERMENTPTAIALKAQELADTAYNAAILTEQQNHFRRVMPPYGQKPASALPQFSVKRAKEIAGRYALCIRLGSNFLPVTGEMFDSMEKANVAWQEHSYHDLIVACACRWSRRWELPMFNPCYKEILASAP